MKSNIDELVPRLSDGRRMAFAKQNGSGNTFGAAEFPLPAALLTRLGRAANAPMPLKEDRQ